MRTYGTLSILAVVAAVVVILSGTHTASAQEPAERLTVVAIDRQAFSGDQDTEELLESLIALMLHLKHGQTFAFVFADDLSTVYGPAESHSDEFRDLREQVQAKIEAPPTSQPIDLVSTIVETYNYLTGLNVGQQTAIYILTGSTSWPMDPASQENRLGPVLDLLEARGWSVFSVVTPDTDVGLTSSLARMTEKTGGRSFELSIPDGFTEMTDWMLRQEGKGGFAPLGMTDLSPNSVWEVDIDIAPGTGLLHMLFFRDEPITSFKLANPHGYEASAGDRTSSTLIEYPHLVIWEVVNPAPGKWRLDASGNGGTLTAGRYSSNRYSIELHSVGAVPVGQPISVVASVMDGDQTVALDAQLTARITDPEGTSLIYDLNDQGTDGDGTASDGYFSAAIPAVASEGAYRVQMELSWPGISYMIKTESEFEAAHFPTISMLPIETEVIEPGVRTRIATLQVNIGEQPFSVPVETLIPTIATNQGAAGNVDIVPRRLISEGKAYEYDVFYTPETETLATVIVTLGVEYADRMYSFTSDPQVVSSIPPSVPAIPALAAPVVVPPTPATPAPPAPEPEASGVPIPLIVVLAIAGVAVLGLLIYWLTRPTPFGYLYTEEGELVVDFNSLRRAPLGSLISRDRVSGDELDVPGLEGVAFKFSGRDALSLRSMPVSSNTVRVNNQPVTDSSPVHDSSFIGALGRLYMFRVDPREA